MNIHDLREGAEIYYRFMEEETGQEFLIEVYIAKDHATYVDYWWVAVHAAEEVCCSPVFTGLITDQDDTEGYEIY